MVITDEYGRIYVSPHNGFILQGYLRRVGLSPRAAARKLQIAERELRAYYARPDVPQYVLLAVKCLVRERIEQEVFDAAYGKDFGRWAAPSRATARRRPNRRPRHKRSKSQ